MMAETVDCVRCGGHNPKITSFVGFHGALGERIKASVCEPCWSEWLRYQLMAINEYRLNLGTLAHRQILERLATDFLKLGEPAEPTAEGEPSIDHIDAVRTPAKDEDL